MSAFCRETGFSESYTYACLRQEKRPSARFRQAVCNWLMLEPELVWPAGEDKVQLTVAQVDELRASLDAARTALA